MIDSEIQQSYLRNSGWVQLYGKWHRGGVGFSEEQALEVQFTGDMVRNLYLLMRAGVWLQSHENVKQFGQSVAKVLEDKELRAHLVTLAKAVVALAKEKP